MMKKTMFRVTVDGSPLGPVPVRFLERCKFETLFFSLIEKREISDKDARKVIWITTKFAWTGGELGGKQFGLRRDKLQDCIVLCDSVRRAHEEDAAARFKGVCNVVVKLHSDDKHTEPY